MSQQHLTALLPMRRIAPARGFTLIEIMVVVVIIGLLAAFIVPSVIGQVDQARVAKVRGDLKAIETALSMYRLDTARYPTSDQGLVALVKKPEDPTVRNWRPGGYLQKVSKDPWGSEYRYAYPGAHGLEYDVYSLGPDGQEGTEETDKDNLGNWNVDG